MDKMADTALTFEQVSYIFPNETIPFINNLSFSLRSGKMYALVGSSGCGKSTLFRLITGLLEPAAGAVCVSGASSHQAGSACAYMPQRDMLLPWRTVEDNVALPLELARVPVAQRHRRVTEMLDRVGLTGYGEKYPNELSGGMRQRAAFARTLLTERDLLLLDEPFSALDALTRMDMQDWLRAMLRVLEKTVILITHDVEEALYLADEVLVIADQPVTTLRRYELSGRTERTRSDVYAMRSLQETLLTMIRGTV